MSKISKLLIMAVVILAVVTMSLNVRAAEAEDLINYVNTAHTINGKVFDLPGADKEALKPCLENISNAQAANALAKIKQAEEIIKNSGATTMAELDSAELSQVTSLAQSAASNVGLNLSVNTGAKTYGVTKANGEVVIPTKSMNAANKSYNAAKGPTGLEVDHGAAAAHLAAVGAANNNGGKTLLYTGANYAVYAVVALAAVAVAVVIKKRA